MKHGKRKVNPANIYPILINNDIEHELIKQSHQKANIVSLDLKKKKQPTRPNYKLFTRDIL